MKWGQKVSVCYDTGTRNGHHIRVRFVPYCSEDEKELEAWFRALTKGHSFGGAPKYFGGWVRHDDSFMPKLLPMFGASAPGDWYSVHKWRDQRRLF